MVAVAISLTPYGFLKRVLFFSGKTKRVSYGADTDWVGCVVWSGSIRVHLFNGMVVNWMACVLGVGHGEDEVKTKEGCVA